MSFYDPFVVLFLLGCSAFSIVLIYLFFDFFRRRS